MPAIVTVNNSPALPISTKELKVGTIYRFDYEGGGAVIGTPIMDREGPTFLPLKVYGLVNDKPFKVFAVMPTDKSAAGHFYKFEGSLTITNE